MWIHFGRVGWWRRKETLEALTGHTLELYLKRCTCSLAGTPHWERQGHVTSCIKIPDETHCCIHTDHHYKDALSSGMKEEDPPVKTNLQPYLFTDCHPAMHYLLLVPEPMMTLTRLGCIWNCPLWWGLPRVIQHVACHLSFAAWVTAGDNFRVEFLVEVVLGIHQIQVIRWEQQLLAPSFKLWRKMHSLTKESFHWTRPSSEEPLIM